MNFWVKKIGVVFGWSILVVATAVHAQVRVSWLEVRDSLGNVVHLEPNFDYAHVAIQVGNRWLHAHPNRGVELVSEQVLEQYGKIREVWASDDEDEANYLDEIPYYLGRPFDNEFSWSDDKIYCAELIAKLLRVAPTPMHFDSKLWSSWYQKYEGKPGSSPSKLYFALQSRGYRQVR
jgi:hypothetical protein